MIIPDQRVLFIMIFYSAAIGALLGGIYDVFRIIRIALQVTNLQKNPANSGKRVNSREIASFVVIFIEDILFFIIAAIITILFIFMANNGQVRLFAVTGEVFGFILYYLTVGRVVKALAEKIIAFIKMIFSLIYKYILAPPALLVRYLSRKITFVARSVYARIRTHYIRKRLGTYTKNEMTRFKKLAESGYGLLDE